MSSFFWIEGMVRDDARRALLFDVDTAIVRLSQQVADERSLVTLTGAYHNLLRMWGARPDAQGGATGVALDLCRRP